MSSLEAHSWEDLLVDTFLGLVLAAELLVVAVYCLPASRFKHGLVQWSAVSPLIRFLQYKFTPFLFLLACLCLRQLVLLLFHFSSSSPPPLPPPPSFSLPLSPSIDPASCLLSSSSSPFHEGETLWWQREEALLACHRRLYLGCFAFVLKLVINRWYYLVRDNADAAILFEQSAKERDRRRLIHEFQPPPLKAMSGMLQMYKWLVNPMFLGLDNIPSDKPILFVGNHALLAFEVPLLIHKLYKDKNMFVRALGDHVHFFLPVWGDLLKHFGVVDGTREICAELMRSRQQILVYPGGAREVFKTRKDKKYELMWKDRIGFAKMAIRYGYTIVPVCSVGTEDMLDVIYDLPMGWIFGRNLRLPVVKPPSPKKLQRIYISFGKPISTAGFEGDDSLENCQEIRDLTKHTIEEGIKYLQEVQEKDPDRLTTQRLAENIRKLTNVYWRRKSSLTTSSTDETNEKEERRHRHPRPPPPSPSLPSIGEEQEEPETEPQESSTEALPPSSPLPFSPHHPSAMHHEQSHLSE